MVDPKLYTLLEVGACGNYTRAAETLGLTQPAVSQHIKMLGEEIGCPVFVRRGGELLPTSAGNILIQYAKRERNLYKRLLETIENEQNGVTKLHIGITHTAESGAVAEMLGKYCLMNEDIAINIVSGTINKLYTKLHNYELDMAFVEGKLLSPDISSILLDTDSLMLAVAPEHPLAQKSMVTIEDVKKEKLILRSRSSDTRSLFEANLESNNLRPEEFKIILEVDNIATIKDLIRKGVGASVLARSACLDELIKKKLVLLPIENFSMIRELNLVYHKTFRFTDILESIVKAYHDTKRDIAAT